MQVILYYFVSLFLVCKIRYIVAVTLFVNLYCLIILQSDLIKQHFYVAVNSILGHSTSLMNRLKLLDCQVGLTLDVGYSVDI